MKKTLTPELLAKYFDHTLLKPYATEADFIAFCEDCKKYEFAMAAINPAAVPLCKACLKDTSVHVGAAIGFPLGQNTIETKHFETQDAIAKGADEIDYVIIHELSHLVHFDHSKEFWETVREYMPDYKKAVAILKE